MTPLIPPFDVAMVRVGPWTVTAFGPLVSLGFLTGTWLAARKANRDGLDGNWIHRFAVRVAIAIVVGGHLGNALYEPGLFWHQPVELLRLHHGLSSMGGFCGAVLGLLWFLRGERRAGRPVANDVRWRYLDALIYGFSAGWCLGRLGCFLTHDHIGTATTFWLGVRGVCAHAEGNPAVACHDLGLYEALLSGLVLFPAFIWLDRRGHRPGTIVACWCLVYGATRLYLDDLRLDPRWLSLTPAQHGSVVLIAIGIWIGRMRRRRGPDAQTAAGRVNATAALRKRRLQPAAVALIAGNASLTGAAGGMPPIAF